MTPPSSSRPADIEALMRAVSDPYAVYDGAVPDASRGASAVETAVAELQRQIHGHVSEIARTRDALALNLREAEAQLARAAQENATLKTERDHLMRLKALYERKFASIRDLAKSDQG